VDIFQAFWGFLRAFCEHFASILRAFCEHFAGILQAFWGQRRQFKCQVTLLVCAIFFEQTIQQF
jgi:hypothetical protein